MKKLKAIINFLFPCPTSIRTPKEEVKEVVKPEEENLTEEDRRRKEVLKNLQTLHF